MARRWGILVVVSVTVPALLVPSPASARPEAPAIFFVPHQDDDVLIYGPDLTNHVRAGRRTIAVLLTDGSASKLCQSRYGDDQAACTDERDREFENAMQQLGVEAVVRDDRPRDGALTQAHAVHVMQQLVTRFPRAFLRAPSPRDPHADHAAIGRALRSMPRSQNKRFYLKPSLWAEYPDLGHWVRRRNINRALDAYAGFGRLSAPAGFEEQYGGSRASTDPTNYNLGGADAKYHR